MNTYTSILVNWTELGGGSPGVKYYPTTTAMIFVNENCEDPEDFLTYVRDTILRTLEKNEETLEYFTHKDFKYNRKHFGVKDDPDFPQNSKIWAELVNDFEDHYDRAMLYLARAEKSWSLEVISEGSKIISITTRKLKPVVAKVLCNVPETGENFCIKADYYWLTDPEGNHIKSMIEQPHKFIIDVLKRAGERETNPDQIWRAELSAAGDGIYKVKKLEKESQKPITTIWSLYDELGY